jgi:hypothetical protein
MGIIEMLDCLLTKYTENLSVYNSPFNTVLILPHSPIQSELKYSQSYIKELRTTILLYALKAMQYKRKFISFRKSSAYTRIFHVL